jgi:hypothetical protein
MFLESLVFSSMRLGVPFIAPRQLGAVGDQFGRSFLSSVEWCTEQSGAPPDNHYSSPVRDLLPYLAHSTVGPRDQLAHQTLSGAHRTVRCAHVIPGLQRGEVEVILFVLFPHSGDALWEFGICGKYSHVR